MRPFLAGCFFALFVLPGVAAAQIGNITTGGLSIDTDPQHPGPNTEVTATVNDYTIDAFGAEINWYLNGELRTAATNQREFTFTTGGVGETVQLRLELVSSDGATFTASRTFSPARIDIIMEPETYTPGFYRGAALPSIGSTVRFTALVFSGASLDRNELVYSWRFNGSSLGGGVVGRNQVEAEIPFTPNPTLVVSVSRRDGTLIGTKQMTVPVVDPEVVFYSVSTLNDVHRVALSSPFTISGEDITVRAQPYYLSLPTITAANSVAWKLNNQPLNITDDTAYEVTLSQLRAGRSGRLEIEVRDPDNVIQRTDGVLRFRK